MKNIIIIAGSVILFFGLLMGGCKVLITHIGNSTSCERFNIDNIELRTGIDIPATTNVDCIYDNGIKKVSFTLDTAKVDIVHYLVRNKFTKKDSLYIHGGNTYRTNWTAEYNEDLAALKIRIVYKDVKEES